MKIRFLISLALLLMLSSALLPAAPARAEVKKYQRTVERYHIPDVVLINQDGKKVRIAALLNSEQPVIVDFIYGTCTTICPVLSAGFVNLQRRLGPASRNVRLVSITIDPENDSPKILKDYLKRYRAQPGWDFLTGSRADIDAVMKAFNAYIPDKMSHYPINLIRVPKDGSWVRIFGLLSSREFLEEYQRVAPPAISGVKP
ncbi:MAG: photosynthetic protein synthase I [Geobacteraceae bacterium GWC2_58_44]|nr:MAG: photosynthetic protein synthase I [Geobacteraceae bacterium GWC2_58_44]HBG05630.1 SCO family protein [Geobacter sp.]